MKPRIEHIIKRTLSLPEAAKMIGISPPTLRRFAREKKISHVIIGTRIRFVTNDVEEYIARNTHGIATVSDTPAVRTDSNNTESDPFLG